MNLQELKTKYPLLISYMEDHNYNRQYIRHIKNESLWILRESENYHWKTYDDVYQTCVEKYTNKHTLNYKRNILLVIKLFVLESVVPDGSIHAHKPSYYDGLCAKFKNLIDVYRSVIKSNYIEPYHFHKSYECSACSFLSRLQKQGVFSLECITEKNVIDIFINDTKLSQSYHFKRETACVFKICATFYPSGICSKSHLICLKHERQGGTHNISLKKRPKRSSLYWKTIRLFHCKIELSVCWLFIRDYAVVILEHLHSIK